MQPDCRHCRGLKNPLANERGRLLEIPILLALLVVSIAIGAGQYARHGWPGVVIGTALVFFGVIAAFALLIGGVSALFKLNERLRVHPWFRILRAAGKWALLLAFFFLWSVLATMGLAGLFEVDWTGVQSEWALNLIAAAVAVVWAILCHRLGPAFWPLFWRFSALLLAGGVAVFVAMLFGPAVVAAPSHLTLILKIVFFLPLVAYAAVKRFKKTVPAPEDESP